MDLKKIGSNLDINAVVIHQLHKIAGERKVSLKTASKILSIGEKEKTFIGKLNDSYLRKSNPTYGIFAESNPAFKNSLEEYLIKDEFYNFSISAASNYKKTLENTISATGGFLIFADYVDLNNRNRYMLILTINNKDGYVVSEKDLTIQDIKNLDTSKVDIACLINLSRWKTVADELSTESRTYLSFIRGNKDVSFYFLSFIDCDNKTTNTESSKRLVRAIDAYSLEKGYDRKTKIGLKNMVSDYCTRQMKEKKTISLGAISAIINPEANEEFQEFAASEEFGVSESIKVDRAVLRRIKYVSYKDDDFTLEFDINQLGKNVIYNEDKRELTFKRIPDALTNQLK